MLEEWMIERPLVCIEDPEPKLLISSADVSLSVNDSHDCQPLGEKHNGEICPKQERTRLTEAQRNKLWTSFAYCPYPNPAQKRKLAEDSQLTYTQVNDFFSNTRTRLRKKVRRPSFRRSSVLHTVKGRKTGVKGFPDAVCKILMNSYKEKVYLTRGERIDLMQIILVQTGFVITELQIAHWLVNARQRHPIPGRLQSSWKKSFESLSASLLGARVK